MMKIRFLENSGDFATATNLRGVVFVGGIQVLVPRPNQRWRLRLFPRCLPCLGGRLHLKCAPLVEVAALGISIRTTTRLPDGWQTRS